MTVNLRDANNGELMTISALEKHDDVLVIRGKIYGAMPMSVYLRPEDARQILGMLNMRLIMFLISLPFRKGARPKA